MGGEIGEPRAKLARFSGSAGRLSLILALGTSLVVLGQGAGSPVLPEYALGFGVGSSGLAWAVALYALGRLLVTFPTGLLAHRVRARYVLPGSCAVSALGVIGTGLAPSFPYLLASRVVAGMGSGVYMTSAILAIVATAPVGNRAKLIGFNHTVLLGTVTVAPALGGLLGETLGLRLPFVLVGTVSMLGAVALWWLLPWATRPGASGRAADVEQEIDEPAPRTQGSLPGAFGSLADPAGQLSSPAEVRGEGRGPDSIIWSALIVASMVNLMVFATGSGVRQTILPLLGVERFGMTVGSLGALFTMMSAVSLLALPVTSWAGDRFGAVQTIAPALVVAAVGSVVSGLAGSMAELWIGSAAIAAGSALTGPAAAWAADVSPNSRLGLTMPLFRSGGDSGSMLGPLVLGSISASTSLGGSLLAHAGAFLGLGGAAVAVALATRRLRRRGPADGP